jgi:hypothetical protein
MVTGSWVAQALYVVAGLGIAEIALLHFSLFVARQISINDSRGTGEHVRMLR